MDAIGFFNNREARFIVTKTTIKTPITHSTPYIQQQKQYIEIEVNTRDKKIGNWLLVIHSNHSRMRVEIQVTTKSKLILENAVITDIKSVVTPLYIETTTKIVSENFTHEIGKIGTKIWSVS